MRSPSPAALSLRGALLAVAVPGGGLVLALPVSFGVSAVAARVRIGLDPAIFLGMLLVGMLLLCGGAAGAMAATQRRRETIGR